MLEVKEKFKAHQCIFGVLYTNRQSLMEEAESPVKRPPSPMSERSEKKKKQRRPMKRLVSMASEYQTGLKKAQSVTLTEL